MKREEIIIRTLIMLAGLGVIIYFSLRGSTKPVESIKTPPKRLKKQDTTQTVYLYPSGDKGTLRYDWKTGEKGTEIN